jgi:hypothetical protein
VPDRIYIDDACDGCGAKDVFGIMWRGLPRRLFLCDGCVHSGNEVMRVRHAYSELGDSSGERSAAEKS